MKKITLSLAALLMTTLPLLADIQMAPDGTYMGGGDIKMTPDGTYINVPKPTYEE